MHEERDTLWHFVMFIVKYRESHYVTVLDMYGQIPALLPILDTCHTSRIGELKKMELEMWGKSGCKLNVITIKQYSRTLWLQKIWRTKW